ncbi:hypothetical protein DICPUDRAFT_147762 [Dictyostelium purpureum]|uniref:Uncharacterized protein n=1 Tax=Dictyostelium purpureum TaxID=5786 RepID=F0Z9C1_DICPU|nr:uncharacterized protein DICPUDRAFT_147762 [Dictyostelium purpureum]EGC39444.1 hypothetical protein DICPUDRAFT_147762 [Dictyostelium purpureum]|eukprot:XP_003284002.1 hypothetical protein DICPUDRAFT_147762 [Dictyostelium purpureum]
MSMDNKVSNNSNNNKVKIKQQKDTDNETEKKQTIEIVTHSSNVTNLIDSWLLGSSFLDKYKEEDNENENVLSKYTMDSNKSISNDPNQNIHVKNSSPFHLLDNNNNNNNNNKNNKNNNNNNNNNKNQNNNSNNPVKKGEITAATKNQLDNILNSNNKKQKNFITSQNNNHLFRSHPYSKNSKNNNDDESRRSSIGKLRSNNTPKKIGMWD